MGFGETIVLIVAIVVIGRVMSGGRWNRETRRWEKNSPDNPYVRAVSSDEVPLLRKEIQKLNDRIQTLEKIVIDPSRQLSDEIERLRGLPPVSRRPDERPNA